MWFVEFIDVNFLFFDEEEIGDYNDGDGSKYDGIRRYESEEVGSGGKDFLRDKILDIDGDSDELVMLNVYVFGSEWSYVVGGGNGVGSDVGGDVIESLDEGGEEYGIVIIGRGVLKSLMRR